MKIYKHFLVKNRCYKKAAKFYKGKPVGIIVHSTGCVNKNVTRYVDDSTLGKVSPNHWNKPTISKCVNAMVGWADKKKDVVAVYTLPDSYRPWGCGSGKKGSYNSSYWQFEICESTTTDTKYFKKAYRVAVLLVANMCKKYNIPVSKVISHAEAHRLGYATDHGDADSYFKHFGKTMNDFRADVKKLL
ncbi:N-acetylmuramoyl-L-alanine amidase domain protein [Lachnospiraceae bacterium TWA4]|nr:N-acetylmuramoyl-L-alanine amidase domain protein [Lachnospiraceae bacterium TWA4]